ncbi:MAG: trehalase calcium-binding domain-containing protein [Tenacibaculum sp.]
MKFYIYKKSLIKKLLKQEDTTHSYTITIEDKGDKYFQLKSIQGKEIAIQGTYHLSNLLQEAVMMQGDSGEISLDKIV